MTHSQPEWTPHLLEGQMYGYDDHTVLIEW